MEEAKSSEIEAYLRAVRPGITARTHTVEGLGEWGELEIRGVLVTDLALPPIPTFDGRENVPVAAALAALEDFRARGVRVVLLRVHCAGGCSAAGAALEDALRAFSAGGGVIVSYVDRVASSSASAFALCADVVAMAPWASFAVHRALGFDVATMEPMPAAAPSLERINRRMLAVYAERTLTPFSDLDLWVHLGPNDRGEPTHAEIFAEAALSHGWADCVLPPEAVEALVLGVLGGRPFYSARRAALASRGAVVAPPPALEPLPEGVAAGAIATSNFASTGSGANEVATAGAKMQVDGYALLAAVDGVRFGPTKFSDLWSWGWQRCNASASYTSTGAGYVLLSSYTGAARSASFVRGVITTGSTVMALKVTAAGNYLLTWGGNFSDGTGLMNIAVYVAKNGVVDTSTLSQTRARDASVYYHLGGTYFFALAANDQLELARAVGSSGTTTSFQNLEFILTRLPD